MNYLSIERRETKGILTDDCDIPFIVHCEELFCKFFMGLLSLEIFELKQNMAVMREMRLDSKWDPLYSNKALFMAYFG